MKQHKGTIFGKKVHVHDGYILIGLYRHPDGRLVVRMTSLIVKEEGSEIETQNSIYTLKDSEDAFPSEIEAETIARAQGYL